MCPCSGGTGSNRSGGGTWSRTSACHCRPEEPNDRDFGRNWTKAASSPMSRLQRGSGSLDPLFGINIDRRVGRATLFTSVAARTPVAENKHGLRTGAAWEVGGGLARELGTHRLAGYVRTGWLHREQDVFNGVPVLVGGGNWLSLAPGVALQVGSGITVQAEVKVPLHRALSNRQLDSAAVFQLGVSRAF